MIFDLTLGIFNLVLLIGQTEPIALGEVAIKIAIVTLFIAVVGFGAALWLRTKSNPTLANPIKRSLSSFFETSRETIEVDQISIVSSRRLAQGQTLVAVKWKGKTILLGSTTTNITCLAVETDEKVLDMDS